MLTAVSSSSGSKKPSWFSRRTLCLSPAVLNTPRSTSCSSRRMTESWVV